MTAAPTALFQLTGTDPAAALMAGAGKLTLTPAGEASAGAYRVLDTFDGAVRGAGALLVEADGRLRLIADTGAVQEQDAARTGNFVQDMADGPVRDSLMGLSPLRSLSPVADGTVQDQQYTLTDSHGKTQVRAQTMILHPQDGTGLTLVTVQALRGYGKAFDRLCAALGAAQDQLGETGSDTLHARLCPAVRPHKAKPKVALARTGPARAAASNLIAAHIPLARATEPGIIADLDTEYLHDYRVALRKVRSVLSLFKGVYSEAVTGDLKAAFSGIMGRTGRLRDLDVYLLDKDHYFNMVPDTLHPGLIEMFRLFEAERRREHTRFARYLRSPAYNRDIAALQARFDHPDALDPGPDADRPAFDFACNLIWKRYHKVCKIASAIHADTGDDAVHELRIHCKKLRYLMEFFAPFFPKQDIKALIQALKGLQDNLGLFNDYSVQQDSLKTFLDTHDKMSRARYAAVAQSIGALIAILHRRQTGERAKVMMNFAQFDSPEVRDTARRLFKNEGEAA